MRRAVVAKHRVNHLIPTTVGNLTDTLLLVEFRR